MGEPLPQVRPGREIRMMLSLHRGMGSACTPTSSELAAAQQALANASAAYGVPLNILQAVAQQESSMCPRAVSSAGAQGLMQLMPATAASLGVTNPFDPQQSANGGAQYLAQLFQQYGDWNTALIAYNQGPGALAQNGPYSSSQQYASTILANAGVSSPSGGPSDIPASDIFGNPIEGPVTQASSSNLGIPLLAGAAAIAAYALFT